MNFQSSRNELLGHTAVKNLNARFFDACYCTTAEEAAKKALSYISENASVTWGGSMSLEESGLLTMLKDGNYRLWDRENVPQEQKQDFYRQAFCADFYLMSANAVSITGELVNLDGTGNRVAALAYGPKNIIVLAGINKIAYTLTDAISRVRQQAAPLNTQRFELSTPCRQTGICADCTSPDSICAQLLITRLCRPKGRIKVILAGEPLGF